MQARDDQRARGMTMIPSRERPPCVAPGTKRSDPPPRALAKPLCRSWASGHRKVSPRYPPRARLTQSMAMLFTVGAARYIAVRHRYGARHAREAGAADPGRSVGSKGAGNGTIRTRLNAPEPRNRSLQSPLPQFDSGRRLKQTPCSRWVSVVGERPGYPGVTRKRRGISWRSVANTCSRAPSEAIGSAETECSRPCRWQSGERLPVHLVEVVGRPRDRGPERDALAPSSPRRHAGTASTRRTALMVASCPRRRPTCAPRDPTS